MKLIPSEHHLPTRPKKKIGHDLKIVKKACHKMMKYTKSEGNLTIEELNELNLDLERSILSIQRRKKKLIEKKSKRRV
jgi:hypothetical protein